MTWWGKVMGGAFGFMLGGPLGAVLGTALGHHFDRGMRGISVGDEGEVERVQTAFFTATFSMMGHLAKADGLVSAQEISVARDIMRQMRLSPEQKQLAIKLFEQGKQRSFPAMDALHQFRQVCGRRRNLLQMFLEILILTALADGRVHQAETLVLRHSAKALGFDEAEFHDILARVKAQTRFEEVQGHARSAGQALAAAYEVLGISAEASDDEVKRAYRRQMNQHHPDKLVAKGLPQEMMDIAHQKTQDIREAYDLIRQSRAM